MTLTFVPGSVDPEQASIGIEAGISDATVVGRPSPVPSSIPRSQMYFWTKVWQADEEEAQREIDAGQIQRFVNSRDAIRWLLDNDH